jgi:RNA polymerase sigma-70 factor (ECF subfamily)
MGKTMCGRQPRGWVDEAELIDRVLAGDAAAERALYDAHVHRIYQLAFRFTGDDDMARDLTQETFIRAFDRIATFRRQSSLSTWLHTIGVSVALNRVRSNKRSQGRELSLDDVAEPAGQTRSSEPDLKERMAVAIDRLPRGYRTVFVMHDVQGYTHEEIGTVLGIDAGTSKAQLSRARAKLRSALADFAGEWLS